MSVRRIFHRIVTVLRPGRAEDELMKEMAAHLALLADEFERRGLTPGA